MEAGDEPGYPKSLDGLEFRSLYKFEIGALPTGPVTGYRKLKFHKGEFTYIPSDGIETGPYEWDPKTGKVEGKSLSEKVFKGKYDQAKKILTWEGVKYKILDPEKPKKQN